MKFILSFLLVMTMAYEAFKVQRRADEMDYYTWGTHRITNIQTDYLRNKLTNKRWSPELVSQLGCLLHGEFIHNQWPKLKMWNSQNFKHKHNEKGKGLFVELSHSKRSSHRHMSNRKGHVFPEEREVKADKNCC